MARAAAEDESLARDAEAAAAAKRALLATARRQHYPQSHYAQDYVAAPASWTTPFTVPAPFGQAHVSHAAVPRYYQVVNGPFGHAPVEVHAAAASRRHRW